MTLLGRIVPKILQFFFVVWATYTVTFLLIRVLPGDPVLAALAVQSGDATTVDPAQLAELREKAGLSGSLLDQYFGQLGGLLRGDLGTSLATGRPVAQMIGEVVPNSLAVGGLALLIGVAVSFLIAFLAYLSPKRWLRDLLVQLPPLGVAVPAFVTGLLLITLFSFTLGWFPASGARVPAAVVLPGLTLAFPIGAIFFQVFSTAVREAEQSPFVFTADVKGLSRLAVFCRHILPAALLPSVTTIGLLIGFLAGGTAVVETVFSRDGIGRAVVAAVQARDVNVIQGVIIVVAVIYALAALLVDLSYPLLDPRLRGRSGRASSDAAADTPEADALEADAPNAPAASEGGTR